MPINRLAFIDEVMSDLFRCEFKVRIFIVETSKNCQKFPFFSKVHVQKFGICLLYSFEKIAIDLQRTKYYFSVSPIQVQWKNVVGYTQVCLGVNITRVNMSTYADTPLKILKVQA